VLGLPFLFPLEAKAIKDKKKIQVRQINFFIIFGYLKLSIKLSINQAPDYKISLSLTGCLSAGFLNLGRGPFTKAEYLRMEWNIFSCLVLTFSDFFTEVVKVDEFLEFPLKAKAIKEKERMRVRHNSFFMV
jgi:hypothetical protein